MKLGFSTVFLQLLGLVVSWPSFYYYPRPSSTDPVILLASDSLASTEFDASADTVFIVHGFTSSALDSRLQEMKDTLNGYTDVNTILVDWSEGAAGPDTQNVDVIESFYLQAISNLPSLAQNISTFILNNNIDPNTVTCVGHSLGAHGCGLAGKVYRSATGNRLARVSGLDPAGPSFVDQISGQLVSRKKRLADTDAVYVDCIFTSSLLGIVEPICRANFYPNQLTGQPQCGSYDFDCQHWAAVSYYTASIPGNCLFIAKRCANYQTQCSMCTSVHPNKCIQMGWYANNYQSANGTFNLVTQATEPYCVN